MPTYSVEAVYQYLAHDILPDNLKVQQKYYLRRRANNFVLNYDILYIKKVIKQHGELTEKCLKVIRTEEERKMVIKTFHEGLTNSLEGSSPSGHFGINRTRRKLSEKYWWPNMSLDINDYVASCDTCKASCLIDKPTPAIHPAEIPLIPWCKVGIDICNMPMTKSGHCCLLVMIDYFTKWVHALPMRSHAAAEVGKKLYETCCIFGFPKKIVSDQGIDFVNQITDILFKKTGTKHCITSAYDPEANEFVEKENRTLVSMLVKMLRENVEDWTNTLPGVLYALRTTPQQSTQCTPWYLMYNRKPLNPFTKENVNIKIKGPNPENNAKKSGSSRHSNRRLQKKIL